MSVSVVVCGYEVISVNTTDIPEPLLVGLSTLDATGPSYDLEAWFSTNDTFCPVTEYKLKASTWTDTDGFDSADLTSDNFELVNSTFLDFNSTTAGDTDFKVVITTISSVLLERNVELSVCSDSDQTITPTGDTISVDVTKNQAGTDGYVDGLSDVEV
jgi:hypothetical protein